MSELGSPEQLITFILMIISVWVLHIAFKTFERGHFWTYVSKLMKWDGKDLMENLILAIRINIFLKELSL